MTEDKNYVLEKEYGTIFRRTNPRTNEETEIKLTKTSWFGKPAKWDLRNWTDGIPKAGVVIGSDESLTKLRDLLIQICKGIAESDYEDF